MKKIGVFLVLSLLLLLSFVSAQRSIIPNTFSGISIASFIESFVDEVKPVVKLLVGDSGSESNLDSNFLFAKLLLLILVISVIWVPVKMLPFVGNERKGIAFIISLIFGLLSIRFLHSEIISSILLPYSAIGITITAFLPLLLYFVWVEKGLEGSSYTVMRKSAWIFALIVFISLYFIRLPLLEPSGYAWIYMIAGLCCFGFLLFDKTIQKAFIRNKSAGLIDVREMQGRANFVEKLAKIQNQWMEGHMSDADYKKIILKHTATAKYFNIPLPDVSHL